MSASRVRDCCIVSRDLVWISTSKKRKLTISINVEKQRQKIARVRRTVQRLLLSLGIAPNRRFNARFAAKVLCFSFCVCFFLPSLALEIPRCILRTHVLSNFRHVKRMMWRSLLYTPHLRLPLMLLKLDLLLYSHFEWRKRSLRTCVPYISATIWLLGGISFKMAEGKDHR